MTDAQQVLIHTEGLSRTYGKESQRIRALDNVSLTIRLGEFVTIMGPSGSGKSTLLNILGLLDRSTHGNYYLASEKVSDISADERANIRNHKLGFIFQSFMLLPRTTALENVELPLIYSGIEKAKREKLASQALNEVGLQHRLHHIPNQLSGGEQQRVAIARSLVTDPLLILADEPTGALDSRNGSEIMKLLQGLNRSGRTIIMVTHDLNVAKFAERVLLLSDGRIIRDKPIHSSQQSSEKVHGSG